ncbi:Pescadillo N-terminus-domain-containing protein [Armillaria borealis]|uniref:Pescadillo homolog n=1 Tax=Armillaria borealis TaxID=47425 RepID=A0AA39N2Y0_9AGAR|nr:Pescadillo N-terminus-domain-containing protein [Armillaria borealis]
MGRLRQKGKAGAAKAYVTRSSAVKRLQCSLADFRRLCILKGIFPREPRSRKRANKGSSAPTTFYYTKDIAFLAHEPVLKKLREHKAFAKKLSRALGRGEWSDAKSLEENKPVYRLDHIIKERYPSFIDALRDIDDALCMISLFANLPSNPRIPPSLIENCSRLSLRKAFFSIKGVYYQVEVMDQTVTWLVPYQFSQNIPTDVDVRLYQTLLGFVFFKLYTDAGLVYPPSLDMKKYDGGAGVGAFGLQEIVQKVVDVDGRKISTKDVRQTIKSMTTDSSGVEGADVIMSSLEEVPQDTDEDFVPHVSASDALPASLQHPLFSRRIHFFLSRETSRPIFEFLVRSFGGRIGWESSSGDGSPLSFSDDSITHVIIDRPVVERTDETSEERQRRLRRKYVQPQWVVDCINAGKILLEEPYAQGKTLPPHLSPFGEYEGAYDPTVGTGAQKVAEEEGESESEDSIELPEERSDKRALEAVAAAAAEDESALRAAELAAEVAGVDPSAFEKEVQKSRKKMKKTNDADDESDMNKMMMSKRQKKLYEKMKYGKQKKALEVCNVLTVECLLIICCSGPLWKKKRKVYKRKSESRVRHSRLLRRFFRYSVLSLYSIFVDFTNSDDIRDACNVTKYAKAHHGNFQFPNFGMRFAY